MMSKPSVILTDPLPRPGELKQITILTSREPEEILKALTLFAITEKPSARVYEHLTPRQVEVLALIAVGKSNKEISVELKAAVKTIEAHRQQIMQRLGVHTVAELVLYALRYRAITL